MKTFVISGCTPRSDGRQRGLVVVELAITLPLIILIMFATAELGRAFYQYATLTKAVEAGTRYYASNPNPITEKGTIQKLVVYADPDGSSGDEVLPGFVPGNVTVDDVFNDHVRVSASYKFIPIIGKLPIINKVIGDELTLTATHSMRAL